MKTLFEKLEQLKMMLEINENSDWDVNDASAEFAEMKNILQDIIGEKEHNFNTSVREYLKGKGYFVQNLWTTQDVIEHGENLGYEITEEQAIEIFDLLGRRFDANIGVNWDSLEYVIQEYFNN